MKKKLLKLLIGPNKTIKQALIAFNAVNRKVLVLSESGMYAGVVSIGDIQRALLKDFALDTPVCDICRPLAQTTYMKVGDDLQAVRARMVKERIELMPLVDDSLHLQDIIVWDESFEGALAPCKTGISVPVVIMAGGIGTRLKPLTNIIPKALVPVFDRPIIQEIIDRFRTQGVTRFFLTVNYKADMIRNYFEEQDDCSCTREYLVETEFMGTAGSLNLLAGKIGETFIVSNCDIILEQDYSDIMDYHRKSGNEITVVGALKDYDIPYGVLNTVKGGVLTSLEEKPEQNFMINTGFYVLEPHVLAEIPAAGVFHMTDLIGKVMGRSGKVGVFPVNESAWLDMGDWLEYGKMRTRLQMMH